MFRDIEDEIVPLKRLRPHSFDLKMRSSDVLSLFINFPPLCLFLIENRAVTQLIGGPGVGVRANSALNIGAR